METTITLAGLLDGGVKLTCADAVAIAQSLLCAPELDAAQPPYGAPSLENVAIDGSGTVRCLHTAATPSLVETALILQSLIRHSADRVPGGVRYAVGRALLEVEAPPYDTSDEFSMALARFETEDRTGRIAHLHSRATATRHADQPAAVVDDSPAERRRRQPAASELRRHLREADLRLYEAHQLASGRVASRTARRSGPIAACMVAGVALVAAGELTHARRSSVGPEAFAAPPGQTITATASPAATTSSEGSLAVSSPVEAPAQASADSERSGTSQRLSPLPSRSRDTAARVSGANTRERGRNRTVSRTDWRRSESRARSDRGVVARIRFEWNNPFR